MLLQQDLPWTVVFWCLAYCLELAPKAALKSTYFTTVNELVMNVYIVCNRSLKKYILKCLPREGRPLCTCGTQFVAHKTPSIACVIDLFCAYLSHLTVPTKGISV